MVDGPTVVFGLAGSGNIFCFVKNETKVPSFGNY